MKSTDKNVDLSLKDHFFEAQFASIQDILQAQNLLVDADTLARITSLAQAGYIKAQATLAKLYCSEEDYCDGDPYLADEEPSPELALYWAMEAGASTDCSNYTAIEMARILIKSERPDCRLRALSLVIKAQTSSDSIVQDAALDMVQTLFADFSLEDFLATYKPPTPMTPPAPAATPQKDLF